VLLLDIIEQRPSVPASCQRPTLSTASCQRPYSSTYLNENIVVCRGPLGFPIGSHTGGRLHELPKHFVPHIPACAASKTECMGTLQGAIAQAQSKQFNFPFWRFQSCFGGFIRTQNCSRRPTDDRAAVPVGANTHSSTPARPPTPVTWKTHQSMGFHHAAGRPIPTTAGEGSEARAAEARAAT
jgi:hypothetical protein